MRVLHHILEHFLRELLEDWVAQPYVLEDKVALNIAVIRQTLILFDHLLHRVIRIRDVILYVVLLWHVVFVYLWTHKALLGLPTLG